MKSSIHFAALAGLLLASGAATAAVVVQYVQPDQFTDLGRVPWQRQQALDDIKEHFQKLGESLPPGRDLTIDVLDVDLAGREQPNGFGSDELRVIRGNGDWPAMRLHYKLSDHGAVIASGDAALSDRALHDHINVYPRDVRLPYEKQMIDEWWRKTIAPLAGAKP